MGIFTEMCICPNQQIVSANQNINPKNDLEGNILVQTDNKDNLEEKNDNKKNNNNNEVNNDAETFNVSSKGGMMASKRKKKGKDKLSHKGTEKDKKEKRSDKKIDEHNMINNGLIEDNIDDSNISDTIVSEIILSEKLKLIPKEKRSKMKDSNKINIVIIGQKEVGKSSFCIRFVENRFEDFYIPSIGVEKFAKMTAYNSRNFKINFSVICGSDKLKKWINLIEEADFFFFFYDITKIKSFNYLNLYLNQLKNYLFLCDKDDKTPNFCIIGNKYDLEGENKIGNDIINKMVNNYGIKYFDISVKSLRNINNLIQFFIKIYDKLAFHEK